MSQPQESAESQRRKELYGLGRCLARDAAKKKLVEDHLEQNFKNGYEIVDSNHTFQTTTAGHHGVRGLCIETITFHCINSLIAQGVSRISQG